jgi:hypothetical protein
MRLLLTIADTFMIAGRGLIVVPGPAIDELRGPGDVTTELRRPDGSTLAATLNVGPTFGPPPSAIRRWNCVFRALSKADVPLGTQVWCDEAFFVESDARRGEAGQSR